MASSIASRVVGGHGAEETGLNTVSGTSTSTSADPNIHNNFEEPFNVGYRRMFSPNKLTLGVFFPIEAYTGDIPSMKNQVELAKRAEELGFAAVWFRDVPLRDPNFGDVGQIYDPWVYMGFIAAQTKSIALATGSIIFTLEHPLHIAKAASSVDQLSGGRLVMGIASGDRPIEYPAFGESFQQREQKFREAVAYFRAATTEDFPVVQSPLGIMIGSVDLLPKPTARRGIPLLITGYSRQTLPWIAEHGDGWLFYPQPPERQKKVVEEWRKSTSPHFKPFAQSLYVDLTEDPDTPPLPIHLGYRLGRNHLLELLRKMQNVVGVNHIVLNLKYGSRPAGEVLEEIGKYIAPEFPPHQ